ncbi:hypothetical protein EASAB2608_03598 [Streptomyces sp. EAS-AB2608]|nr:hypothetical protein EASAB2608_03598 [Streptomyces sp. EAS-AB2608]
MGDAFEDRFVGPQPLVDAGAGRLTRWLGSGGEGDRPALGAEDRRGGAAYGVRYGARYARRNALTPALSRRSVSGSGRGSTP